ncbi:MAG: c-type cytochrome [Verrucomicrobiales bacterium]|nr:c-type cytochrome [Verrucomicrobiales bacterium]
MKSLLLYALLWASSYGVEAASGPLRVLFLGDGSEPSRSHCHVVMRELGRDAIWFDYLSEPKWLTPDLLARFDAILFDASAPPAAGFLFGQAADRVFKVTFTGDSRAWSSPEFLTALRGQILTAVGGVRQQGWEKFLAQREPERREPDSNVANYENRPKAITFQHPFNEKGSRERTQVPVDLRLELFASEPDIAKPIGMAWDERGRLWVCETRDYPHEVKPTGEGNDTIKICEDTDGDGRADRFTVFADKLNIPTSLVFVNGGVVVTQPPRLLFLKDTNGDDKADVREVIMEGWGIGDTHAQANNLHYGHDNWLYGCVGYSGFSGSVGGVRKQFAMGTFRFQADGSALEFLHQFSNNSWGHSANEFGDQFGGTANGAPIFYGGIPATAYPAGTRGLTAKKINEEDRVHTITPNYRQVDVFGGYTAAAGSAFIYSDQLPARFQGMAMVCEPTMKTIGLMDVRAKGAGYTAKDGFNLVASTDEWMSPVFAEVGPDGAVWFADWQNFIIQHNPTPSVSRGGYDAKTGVGGAHENPLRDHVRGRVYRVVWDQAKKAAPKSLKGASDDELVRSLSHPNPFWRLTAQRLLVEGKRSGVAGGLRQLVTARETGVGAIHALWSLRGIGQLDSATLRAALLAKDSALRRNAVRALGNDDEARTSFFSAGVVSDPDLLTRSAALVKLSEFQTTPEVQTLVGTLARNPVHRSDEWLREGIRLLSKKHHTELFKEGPNLLANPGLETVGADGLPEGWKRRDYGNRPANQTAKWEVVRGAGQVRSGSVAVRCTATGDADSSLYADVQLKPNTDYRLSGWVKGKGLRGKISFNDHINRAETERVTRDGDWQLVEATYNSGSAPLASLNILFVARGEGYFDDIKFCELLPLDDAASMVTAGDVKRGEHIVYNHTARCILCHTIKGNGSTVGPALDGIATRKDRTYIKESLLEPSKVLAQGFEGTGLSPMPPMADIFSPQELEDIQAFLQTLR